MSFFSRLFRTKDSEAERLSNERERAFHRWIGDAEQGNAEAQFIVGRSLEVDAGKRQNIPEAIKWYRAAAAQRFEQAYIPLCMFFLVGKLVERSLPEASKWAELAARSSDPETRTIGAELKLIIAVAGNANSQSFDQALAKLPGARRFGL